jgi:penicillin amidase
MLERWRRTKRVRRVVSAVGAVIVSAALLGVMGFGYGTIPALGPALDPGRGAWTSAGGGQPVTSEKLDVPGLTKPVTASFTKDGLASINAENQHDLFLALGYVHAKFRLSEMDLERRLGEGQLAQLTSRATSSSSGWACSAPRRTSGRGRPARRARRCSPTPRA